MNGVNYALTLVLFLLALAFGGGWLSNLLALCSGFLLAYLLPDWATLRDNFEAWHRHGK